ncbi:hypothetical protein [Hominenteromicrobium sp.]|uniref:hypothetical protein n=1 Tax=Hominenteromicrobium sp. TaxID=3073581 RepID=UPI00399B67FE
MKKNARSAKSSAKPATKEAERYETQHFSLCFSAFVPLRRHFDARLFLPTLFSRVMPNFKNKESAAQITGAESPLYLEDPSSLVLPPWNDIDDSKSQGVRF